MTVSLWVSIEGEANSVRVLPKNEAFITEELFNQGIMEGSASLIELCVLPQVAKRVYRQVDCGCLIQIRKTNLNQIFWVLLESMAQGKRLKVEYRGDTS